MTFTPAQALEAVNTVLLEQRPYEAARLERIRMALDPLLDSGQYRLYAQVPADAPPIMLELARQSETNYLPLVLKTFSQIMKVDGYTSLSDSGAVAPWQWWQRNRMDSRQTGIVRGALAYGASYVTVLPGRWGRDQPGPAIQTYSARRMTALYQDVEADEWPMMAVAYNQYPDGTAHVTLYDEEMVYTFGVEVGITQASSLLLPPTSVPYLGGTLTFLEAQAHNVGVTPVVRFRDRNLLAGEEAYGIIEPLMKIQDRINETTFQMMVTQFFQAFKQRYVLGWIPKDEQEELKAAASRVWYFEDEQVKVGQLDAGDPKTYVETRNASIRDMFAIAQLPAQAGGIDGIHNVSDAALAGLEAAKNREASEITTSLGESYEQMLRLCAFLDDNQAAADDYASETRWRNFEARSFSQTVDGLTKLAQGLGIPGEDLVQDIPGMTGQRVDDIKQDIRKARASASLAALSQAAGRGVTG